MVTGGDQQDGGDIGADTVEVEQARGVGTDEGHDELVEAGDLALQELGSSSELVQRHPGGMADNFTTTGPQASQAGD
jgi:hypothetical protein